jgi:hypothetical protein
VGGSGPLFSFGFACGGIFRIASQSLRRARFLEAGGCFRPAAVIAPVVEMIGHFHHLFRS